MKNEKLNKWLWKWHFIAGLISLPFIIILSITGTLYLFKADYESPKQKHIKEITISGEAISFDSQREIAIKSTIKTPSSMVVPKTKNQATEFISGKFGGKTSVYIDPYKANVSGKILPKNTLMHKIRKLHGELLLGKWGTKVVELIASWMVVLIITGLYVWWPKKKWKLKGLFIPRTGVDKRTFYRDMHAVSSFWISILLLFILAGGFPWTDVFGANFKKVQKITNTGYPSTWSGHQFKSDIKQEPISLDKMVSIVNKLNLDGNVTIEFPKGKQGIYSVSNELFSNQKDQKKYHFDQYTGKLIHKDNWQDVGVLMRGRMWVMAFHQGQFGAWNWWLMFFTGLALLIASLSAVVSYLLRKRKGDWGTPKVPKQFKVGYGIIGILILLSIIFPLFGISLLLILLYEVFKKTNKKTCV